MSPLWVLPVCVLALGAVAVALAARRLAGEVALLRADLGGLRHLADEAIAARADVDAARSRAHAVAHAPARFRARLAALREARAGGADR